MNAIRGAALGWLAVGLGSACLTAELKVSAPLCKPQPMTMAQLARRRPDGVAAYEVTDYVYGNYQGELASPPHADLNPRRAVVVVWRGTAYRLVFAHEGSYCPWLEFPSGAAVCYQFFEGNDGWAELFNQWGRQERNSFVEVLDPGPKRAWIRWTYFGVNLQTGQAAYRASEDFWAYPNGLVLRRQSYQTLLPGKHAGYAREPIELIGMCPVARRWFDVLRKSPEIDESHALCVLDLFSERRYDVYWKYKPGTLRDSTHRRTGCAWKELDDSAGVALVLPLKEGLAFCAFGDASGFRRDYTRIKEHTFADTGGAGWGSCSWDHWPIGWLNSQGHEVDASTLARYPNHFSPAGMDFFALADDESARGVYFSLIGAGNGSEEEIRRIAGRWLSEGAAAIVRGDGAAGLPAVWNIEGK